MNPPSPLRASALLVLVLAISACGDAAAPAITITRPAPTVLLRAGTAFNLRVCVADAVERIAPMLGSADELKSITNALDLVNHALDTRVPPQLTSAARSLRGALDQYFAARPERALEPDAFVMRLLLDDLEAVAQNPPLDTLRTH